MNQKGALVRLIEDITIDGDTEFMVTKSSGILVDVKDTDVVLDMNGHTINVTADAVMDGKSIATALFACRSGSLTVIGDGTINIENQAIAFYSWTKSDITIYGDLTVNSNSGDRKESDLYVNSEDSTLHVYDGTYHGYGINTHDKIKKPVLFVGDGVVFGNTYKNLFDADMGRTSIAVEEGAQIVNIGTAESPMWQVQSVDGVVPNFDYAWIDGGKVGTITIDGIAYNIYARLYSSVLPVGATTTEDLVSVTLDERVDITPEGDWYAVEAGVATPLNWSNDDGYPTIYVSAYAIQDEGFSTVEEAYAAYQAQWGDQGAEYNSNVIMVTTADEMRAAMKVEGAKIVLANDILVDDDKGTGYCFYAKYDCEIDLNGNDIIVDLPGQEFWGVFYGCNGAELDVRGYGNISIIAGVGYFARVTGNGDVGANRPADGSTVNIYGGNWTQTSADFTNKNYCEGLYANRGGILNVYGGTFDWNNFEKLTANEASNGGVAGIVTIYGGTFVNFDPRVSHDNDGSYVAEGYTVVSETQANGDVWYTVVKA